MRGYVAVIGVQHMMDPAGQISSDPCGVDTYDSWFVMWPKKCVLAVVVRYQNLFCLLTFHCFSSVNLEKLQKNWPKLQKLLSSSWNVELGLYHVDISTSSCD